MTVTKYVFPIQHLIIHTHISYSKIRLTKILLKEIIIHFSVKTGIDIELGQFPPYPSKSKFFTNVDRMKSMFRQPPNHLTLGLSGKLLKIYSYLIVGHEDIIFVNLYLSRPVLKFVGQSFSQWHCKSFSLFFVFTGYISFITLK